MHISFRDQTLFYSFTEIYIRLLLFYKAGYIVGKYTSMEMLIEKTKETYYEALQSSSTGGHECESSYEPFVKYYLGILLKAYNEFESRVEHLKNRKLSKPERIKAVIDQKKNYKERNYRTLPGYKQSYS